MVCGNDFPSMSMYRPILPSSKTAMAKCSGLESIDTARMFRSQDVLLKSRIDCPSISYVYNSGPAEVRKYLPQRLVVHTEMLLCISESGDSG